ncbi:PGF-CTERM sorting domain-containing protein [Methanoculleus horonobensis]
MFPSAAKPSYTPAPQSLPLKTAAPLPGFGAAVAAAGLLIAARHLRKQ